MLEECYVNEDLRKTMPANDINLTRYFDGKYMTLTDIRCSNTSNWYDWYIRKLRTYNLATLN